MRRGTTPTLTLTVDAYIASWFVYVTLQNGSSIVTFEDDRLTKTQNDGKTTIELTLTQAETLAFAVGDAEVQIRAYKDGKAIASNIKTIGIRRIILDGEIDGDGL